MSVSPLFEVFIGFGIGLLYQLGLACRVFIAQKNLCKSVQRVVCISFLSYAAVGLGFGWMATHQPAPIVSAGQLAIGFFVAHVLGWLGLARYGHCFQQKDLTKTLD